MLFICLLSGSLIIVQIIGMEITEETLVTLNFRYACNGNTRSSDERDVEIQSLNQNTTFLVDCPNVHLAEYEISQIVEEDSHLQCSLPSNSKGSVAYQSFKVVDIECYDHNEQNTVIHFLTTNDAKFCC